MGAMCTSTARKVSDAEITSDGEKSDLEKQFDAADANHDGKLDRDEFKAMVLKAFPGYDDDYVDEMFAAADADGNGFVDLREFKSLNFLSTVTSTRGATMRAVRLKDIIPDETEELKEQFAEYGLIEDQHGEGHEFTIIAFSWYTGTSEEILTYYEGFLSQLKNTRVVAVNGPLRDITIRPDNPGHRWYDYYSDLPSTTGNPNLEDKCNEAELKESREKMLELLNYEVERIGDSKRVFFIACSQGGFMALDVAMNSPHELGGVFGNCTTLGSYSPITTSEKALVFQYHGDKDQVIGLGLAQKGKQRMMDHGVECYLEIEEGKTHYTDQQGEVDQMIKTFGEWMSRPMYTETTE